jgi:hypothetical protein
MPELRQPAHQAGGFRHRSRWKQEQRLLWPLLREKMEEMIEICVPYAVKAGKYKDSNAARTAMRGFLPKLKRWASA